VVEVIAAHAQKLAVRVLRSDGRPPPRKTRFPDAAVGGPPREFAVEARFPEWITCTLPGVGKKGSGAFSTAEKAPDPFFPVATPKAGGVNPLRPLF